MMILKFGGTSVGSVESIKQVIEIVSRYHQEGQQIYMVVSAFSGITNDLIQAAELAAAGNREFVDIFKKVQLRHLDFTKNLLTEPKILAQTESTVGFLLADLHNILNSLFFLRESTSKTQDLVSSFGERLSATILAGAIVSQGLEAEFLDARKVIVTDSHFGRARVNFLLTNNKITDHHKEHKKIQVVTGFIGSTIKGETTTLGRGGSDYTASIFGAALDAEEIQIWTDVDGVLTADPRKVSEAYPLKFLSYKSAMEISYLGAKVLYPPTIQPAMNKTIPIRIKNTFNPTHPGTLISQKSPDFNNNLQTLVKSLPSMTKISLLTVQGTGLRGVSGISGRLFGILGKNNINIILISQTSSEYAISFAVQEDQAELAKQKVHDEFSIEIANQEMDEVITQTGLSIVSVVSQGTENNPQILKQVYEVLEEKNIMAETIAQGASKLHISTVVSTIYEVGLLQALHQKFFPQAL